MIFIVKLLGIITVPILHQCAVSICGPREHRFSAVVIDSCFKFF